MEIKKNNSQNLSNSESGFSKKEEKKDGIRSFIKNVFESQVFFNSRIKALEYIEKLGKVTTAMLTMNISKVKGFLCTNYEVKFSILYSTGDGQVYQTKNFYKVEMPGKEGMIPDYILKSLEDEDSIDVKFNIDDLSALYNERDIKIDEESTFDEVIEICKKENVTSLYLIDRVFYTRIECFNSDKEKVGTMHMGVLHRIPKDVAKTLYPVGQAQYVLQ